jgi:hypothetical protein
MDRTAFIGGKPVTISATEATWESGLEIDADGAPRAYAPWHSGLAALDDLRNALHRIDDDPTDPEHGWAGIRVDVLGKPVVQGPDDPAPGYYVSQTALADLTRPVADPRRYVDASAVPYIVVPRALLLQGVMLGDLALVAYRGTGRSSPAIVADVGPPGKLGEGSPALAEALGIPSSARNGGCEKGVLVRIFLESAGIPPWPRTAIDIAAAVDARASST